MANKNIFLSKIIWSADGISLENLLKIVESGALPKGTIIKLDRLFFEKNPKNSISQIQSLGYPVFCDAKIVEIPVKAIAITKTYLEYGPYMLNIMAGACSTLKYSDDVESDKVEALKQFAQECEKAGVLSCAVTVLTSKTKDTCFVEYGNEPLAQVLKYAEIAFSAGVKAIVCSPEEIEALREKYGNEIVIVTPGVRLPDSSSDDQARTATPSEALKKGADFVVIGRDLTRGINDGGDIVERIRQNYERISCHING